MVRDKQIEVDQAQADLEQASGRVRPDGRVGPRPLPFDSHRAQPHSCGVASFGSVLPESLAGSQAKSKGEAEADELMDLQDTVPRCLVRCVSHT